MVGLLWSSKIRVKNDGSSSSAFIVIISLLSANLRSLAKFYTLNPNVITPSLLYSAKPASFKVSDTNATWDGSIAYMEIAVGPASILTF